MAKRTCEIEGCDRPHRARGWCSLHYNRWIKHGSLDDPDPQPTAAERFFAKVDVGDCWLWTAALNNQGYGQFGFERKVVLAHRWAYQHLVRPLALGETLDHLCRTTACVNPDHLEPVTHRENVMRGTAVTARMARQTRCQRGHPFTTPNTIIRTNGARECRTCRNDRQRKQRTNHG